MIKRAIIACIILIILSVGVVYVTLVLNNKNNNPADEVIIEKNFLSYNGVNITWLGTAGFKLKTNDLIVYFDPFSIPVNETDKADIIIASHGHTDHLSLIDITTIANEDVTILYTPYPVKVDEFNVLDEDIQQLELKEINYIKPGDIIEQYGITLEFVPAYNIDKYNPYQPDQLWHPPEANWTGMIVDFGDVRIYHAGDTDHIPEMKQVACDIALIPVMGEAMMTAEEAAEAIESLHVSSIVKYAIPMHYTYPITIKDFGNITIGSLAEAEEFSEKANCTVVILEPIYYYNLN
ncbi:MAG: MBL fold metallo-hydrolase [Candidatus Heimdallarchaeota archaeon]|nr:MAG: MBL fold metallo-hydrolase [Candidatus Heimdallarchaeota archaeon]